MRSNTKRGLAVAAVTGMLLTTAGAVGAKIGGSTDISWFMALSPTLVPATVWGLLDGSRQLWRTFVPRHVSIGRPWAEVYRRSTPPSVSILNYTIDDDDQTS